MKIDFSHQNLQVLRKFITVKTKTKNFNQTQSRFGFKILCTIQKYYKQRIYALEGKVLVEIGTHQKKKKFQRLRKKEKKVREKIQ